MNTKGYQYQESEVFKPIQAPTSHQFIIKTKYVTNRAVTNPKKISDLDPNPNEVSCRISDPDPIIHKIYIKHNKTC